MKKTLFVIIATSLLLSCNGDEVDLALPLIKNYPEKGWYMFASGRDFDDVGTVFGITAQEGTGSVIRSVVKTKPTPHLEMGSSVYFKEDQTVQINAMVKFLKNLVPFNIGLSASSATSIEVSLKVEGAERYVLTDDDMRDAFLTSARLSTEEIFEYKSFYVIKSVIAAKKVSFKFSQSASRELGIRGSVDTTITGSGKYSINSAKEYPLEFSFEKPVNIFYQPISFKPERLVEMRSQQGVAASTSEIVEVPSKTLKSNRPPVHARGDRELGKRETTHLTGKACLELSDGKLQMSLDATIEEVISDFTTFNLNGNVTIYEPPPGKRIAGFRVGTLMSSCFSFDRMQTSWIEDVDVTDAIITHYKWAGDTGKDDDSEEGAGIEITTRPVTVILSDQ